MIGGLTERIEALIAAADEAVAKHGAENAPGALVGRIDQLPLNIRVPALAAVLAAYADERGAHAKTADNFEIFMESMRESEDRTRAERDEARAEVVRLGKELDITIADAQHYRHLYEQLTARVEEVRQSGIEAAEREP